MSQRLKAVRAQMAEHTLDALIVPRADEYLGEYLPAHNERLQWVSGFTGSAGAAIIMRERAAIFVDGRYTLQVRQQVDENLYEIHSLIDSPPVAWLAQQLDAGAHVGYQPQLHSLNWQQGAMKTLAKSNMQLVELSENLVDLCWSDRPSARSKPALLLSEQYSGQASASKRKEIGALIAERNADTAYIFAADSCNWLLNIRGGDVPSLPIVLGSGLLHADGKMVFFADAEKLPTGFAAHVGAGVEVKPESELLAYFSTLEGKTILCDPRTANAWSQLALQRAGVSVVAADDPVLLPKACKSDTEVAGMRNAHIRDAAAEVKFLSWLDAEVAAGRLHDEARLSDTLGELRAQQPLYQETSFNTISAAASNAAMAHYNHLNGTPAKLSMNSVYLVDSGGQYLDGTTDITRTVAIGDPGDEVRERFALVLKGMISLAQAKFPRGTTGKHLDVLARQHLWQQGLDFNHGTGHGVGSCLSVHEGPHSISPAAADVALLPGMVVSDEPGYYKDGGYGMRCENLLVVVELGEMAGSDKKLLGFETLTMVPFDKRMLKRDRLTGAELHWLNSYHSRVWAVLSSDLEGAELNWLERATSPI